MIEYNQLKYFYEVVKAGSFTRASKKLRISQPSISKMVKLLEENQNIRFLDRSKKGVNLTPIGKILFEHCENVFNSMEIMEQAIHGRKELCQGELWIGASDNVCNYLFPQLIKEFQTKNPSSIVKLFGGVSEMIKERMKDFRIEVGVFYTSIKGKEFISDKLCFVPFCVVISPKLIKKTVTIKEIKNLSFVGSQVSDYTSAYPVLVMLRSVGIQPEVKIECNIQETQKKLVMAGAGYAVLPQHMVKEEINSGELYSIKMPKVIGHDLYIATLKNRTLSNAAVIWCNMLKEHFKKY